MIRKLLIFVYLLINTNGFVQAQSPETFFAIHCEPQTAHRFPDLITLVEKANFYDIPLTIQFTPQWVENIMANSQWEQRVRAWQQQGHEIAAHHHGVYHLHWDGYTNYPMEVILARGWSESDFLGSMDKYRKVLESIAGDSLMLTMSGPGNVDPDSSVDWQQDFLFRTGGGRNPENAFSSPREIQMDQYTACQIDHFFIENQLTVNSLKMNYNNKFDLDVVGVVTHVFNFADDSSYVIDWFKFVQNTNRKTAQQIIRERGCNTQTAVKEELHLKQHDFYLATNYPNPFNPNTTINFSIPKSEKVTLKIYNIIGGLVETIVDDHLIAGSYTYAWKTKNQPSGLYFYILEAGQFSATKKMTLLR